MTAENDANVVVSGEVTPGVVKGHSDPARSIPGMGTGGVTHANNSSHKGRNLLVGEPGYTTIYVGGRLRFRGGEGRHE